MSAPVKTLASIAAPSVAQASEPVEAAPRQNAAEKAAVDRGLAETRVESIRIDGLALMKIIKHARDSHHQLPPPATGPNPTASFSPAVGQLLGIDAAGTLEVSNAFPLPAGAFDNSDSESKGVKAATKYTSQLLPRLAVLNADASLVGFYTSTNNGQHLAMGGFVEALLAAQMSGGGIGSGASAKATPVGRSAQAKAASLPAGQGAKNGKGVAIVYDLASAGQGHVGVKAFRLTAAFVETYRSGRFDTDSLIAHKLVPTNILEEVPVTVRASPLLTAFLSTLVTPSSSSAAPSSATLAAPSTPLSPVGSFETLSLPSGSASTPPAPLSAPVSALLSALDTHQSHLSSLSFQARQLARERSRVEALPNVQRRAAENAQRARDGLAALPPTAEELALQEPSRLETMCALGGVEGAARVLSQASGGAVVRSFAGRAGAIVA